MKTILSDCMLNYQQLIADFRPLAGEGVMKPDFRKLSRELSDKLVRDGEYYLQNYTFPCIAPSLYMEYQRTGNRVDFEDVYFTKRMALDSLVLAECVEGKGRFLDRITDGIYSICEETGWWLPAHNSYSRRQTDEAKTEEATALPNPDRPILDLFACETGGILGVTYYLLKDELVKVDPLVPMRIREALEGRIIRPYLTDFFWWMGDGSRSLNNWTTWCTMNVLLTCLTMGENQDTKRRVCRQAAESLDRFLSDYRDDGYCSEGPAYYSHAGLDLAADLGILNSVTDGAFLGPSRSELVKNVLLYICRVYAGNGWYINYSDCAARLGSNGLREYVTGKAFDLPQLRSYGLSRFSLMRRAEEKEGSRAAEGNARQTAGKEKPAGVDEDDLYGSAERNLYLRLQMLFAFDEADREATGGQETAAGDFIFRDAGLCISRSAHLLLAAKAGWNDDSHNHNDVGSIIVYKNGQPLLIDAGVGDYTKKTFSPQRYEIWTMRSSYHNLPDIDGREQAPGPGSRATDVRTDEAPGQIAMNLREAYPGLDDDFFREVRLDRAAEKITLHDFSGRSHRVTHHFMTWFEPQVSADGYSVKIGDLGRISWQGEGSVQIEKIPLKDKRLLRVWGGAVYRVSIEAQTADSVFVIR